MAPEEDPPAEDAEGSMTLAFALAALRELGDPGAAVADARRWADHVGVVADRPRAAAAFARDHGIADDFYGGATVGEMLLVAGERFDTDRYVLVGTTDRHERATEGTDWEYLDVAAAAEAAGWERERQAKRLRARLRALWPL